MTTEFLHRTVSSPSRNRKLLISPDLGARRRRPRAFGCRVPGGAEPGIPRGPRAEFGCAARRMGEASWFRRYPGIDPSARGPDRTQARHRPSVRGVEGSHPDGPRVMDRESGSDPVPQLEAARVVERGVVGRRRCVDRFESGRVQGVRLPGVSRRSITSRRTTWARTAIPRRVRGCIPPRRRHLPLTRSVERGIRLDDDGLVVRSTFGRTIRRSSTQATSMSISSGRRLQLVSRAGPAAVQLAHPSPTSSKDARTSRSRTASRGWSWKREFRRIRGPRAQGAVVPRPRGDRKAMAGPASRHLLQQRQAVPMVDRQLAPRDRGVPCGGERSVVLAGHRAGASCPVPVPVPDRALGPVRALEPSPSPSPTPSTRLQAEPDPHSHSDPDPEWIP